MKRRENLTLQKAVTMYGKEEQAKKQEKIYFAVGLAAPSNVPNYNYSIPNYQIWAANNNQKY